MCAKKRTVRGSTAIISFRLQFGSRLARLFVLLPLVAVLTLAGCHRKASSSQYVYVTAKQTFLRDRVAAVSNRVATVQNGDKLQVLERGRRFLKVQTSAGVQGWIDEKAVATQDIFNQFAALRQQHQNDSVVASAVTRDEVYLHSRPGRDTDRLFRLAEGEKLKLLKRATLPKPLPPGQRPAAPAAASAAPPEPPVMEDWWLVRDSKGETGWLYSRMMDVDVPDAVGRYAEGQRIVGAYVLTTVNDPEAPDGPQGSIPIYVTVLSPYKAGLPYDFDQVRVFTWNTRKHRYETAFRERNIAGYLPVEIATAADPSGKSPVASAPAPVFRYRVLAADAAPVVPDPTTGDIVPGKTIQKTFRLEGNTVRRVLAPGETAPAQARPEPIDDKAAKKKRR